MHCLFVVMGTFLEDGQSLPFSYHEVLEAKNEHKVKEKASSYAASLAESQKRYLSKTYVEKLVRT